MWLRNSRNAPGVMKHRVCIPDDRKRFLTLALQFPPVVAVDLVLGSNGLRRGRGGACNGARAIADLDAKRLIGVEIVAVCPNVEAGGREEGEGPEAASNEVVSARVLASDGQRPEQGRGVRNRNAELGERDKVLPWDNVRVGGWKDAAATGGHYINEGRAEFEMERSGLDSHHLISSIKHHEHIHVHGLADLDRRRTVWDERDRNRSGGAWGKGEGQQPGDHRAR